MIGIPYFPAGRDGAVCPVCHAIVPHDERVDTHWTAAGHTDADVTKETQDKANALAGWGAA